MATPASLNTVLITNIDLPRQRRQFKADAAINPGNLLEQTATGVKVHATDGGAAERLIALSNLAKAATPADAYASGELVQCAVLQTGDEFYGTLKAGGSLTAFGDVISNGDGTLKAAAGTETDGKLIGKALETITAGATYVLFKCRAR